ncbi:unnamed protein product, partial [marine sediment metagenome]
RLESWQVEGKRGVVGGYREMCNVAASKDHGTYDLSAAILNVLTPL